MNKHLPLVPVFCISMIFILLPCFPAGSRSLDVVVSNTFEYKHVSKTVLKQQSDKIYDSLQLENYGLHPEAFEYAYRGHRYLADKGLLENPGIITICDFSQSSAQKRLYVIDIENYELLLNTYVTHGKNSGGEFAQKFSNNPRSHQSSLGFYITKNSYYGEHGLALRLAGMEKGVNDKATYRNIVMHGAPYASEDFLQRNSFLGRSFGCPAVPKEAAEKLIMNIKNGTCLFIYHPSKQYLTGSKILNG